MVNVTIKKSLALFVAVAFVFAGVVSPVAANPGDADLIQTDCNVLPTSTVISFWTKNLLLPEICAVCITPIVGPAYCPVLDARSPTFWLWTLNPNGGVTFQTYDQSKCIQPGTTLTGFKLMVADGTSCCYLVEYKDFAGNVLCTTTECFSCGPVSVEDSSWGSVKALYQ